MKMRCIKAFKSITVCQRPALRTRIRLEVNSGVFGYTSVIAFFCSIRGIYLTFSALFVLCAPGGGGLGYVKGTYNVSEKIEIRPGTKE